MQGLRSLRRHLALARPTMVPIGRSPEGDILYDKIVIFAVSDSRYDNEGVLLFQFWTVKGGHFPYWFLSNNVWEPLNGGIYSRLTSWFMASVYQVIYICPTYDGETQIWVNTPQLDTRDLYAVFHCRRPQAYAMTSAEWTFLCHRFYGFFHSNPQPWLQSAERRLSDREL